MQFFSNLPTFSSNSTELNGFWWGKMLCWNDLSIKNVYVKRWMVQCCEGFYTCHIISPVWSLIRVHVHHTNRAVCFAFLFWWLSVVIGFVAISEFMCSLEMFWKIWSCVNYVICLLKQSFIHHQMPGGGGVGGFTPLPQKYFWLPWL